MRSTTLVSSPITGPAQPQRLRVPFRPARSDAAPRAATAPPVRERAETVKAVPDRHPERHSTAGRRYAVAAGGQGIVDVLVLSV